MHIDLPLVSAAKVPVARAHFSSGISGWSVGRARSRGNARPPYDQSASGAPAFRRERAPVAQETYTARAPRKDRKTAPCAARTARSPAATSPQTSGLSRSRNSAPKRSRFAGRPGNPAFDRSRSGAGRIRSPGVAWARTALADNFWNFLEVPLLAAVCT